MAPSYRVVSSATIGGFHAAAELQIKRSCELLFLALDPASQLVPFNLWQRLFAVFAKEG